MSKLRYNQVRDQWVVIAQERVRRPSDFELTSSEVYDINSPFIYGNEKLTPNEIYAIRPDGSKPNTSGWLTRVVPNKYNAFDINKQPNTIREGIHESMSGFGAHEIIIDTPKFPHSVFDFSVDEMSLVLMTAQKRLNDLKGDIRLSYFQLFKNHGPLAGASLAHAHTQLIALPFIPPQIEREIEVLREYYVKTNRCLITDLVKEEQKSKTRIVQESENFISYCPYAAMYPFEIVVCAREKGGDFIELEKDTILEFADILTRTLSVLKSSLRDVSFNLLFKLTPLVREHRVAGYYHHIQNFYQWRVIIIPRTTISGGLELATGVFINAVSPEDSAKFMRSRANI